MARCLSGTSSNGENVGPVAGDSTRCFRVGACEGRSRAASARCPSLAPQREPWLLQRLRAGFGDLRILLGGGTRHADRADDLPVHEERDPPFQRAGARESQQPKIGPALPDQVLEHLGGTAVENSRIRLVLGGLDAPELRAAGPPMTFSVVLP